MEPGPSVGEKAWEEDKLEDEEEIETVFGPVLCSEAVSGVEPAADFTAVLDLLALTSVLSLGPIPDLERALDIDAALESKPSLDPELVLEAELESRLSLDPLAVLQFGLVESFVVVALASGLELLSRCVLDVLLVLVLQVLLCVPGLGLGLLIPSGASSAPWSSTFSPVDLGVIVGL